MHIVYVPLAVLASELPFGAGGSQCTVLGISAPVCSCLLTIFGCTVSDGRVCTTAKGLSFRHPVACVMGLGCIRPAGLWPFTSLIRRCGSVRAGVTVALMREQSMFPQDSPSGGEPYGGGLGGADPTRWEAVVDPLGLEEDAADCLLRVAGTDSGVTALSLQTSTSGGAQPHAMQLGARACAVLRATMLCMHPNSGKCLQSTGLCVVSQLPLIRAVWLP